MKQKKIQDRSFKYTLLRIYARWVLRFLYSEIIIVGKENIPKDAPVILALNHQNALMDALLVLCNIKQQPVFMARADVFKKPLLIKILTFLKIMPAYRIRDGYSNLSKNDEIFDKAIDTLHDRKMLGIMPEGNHGDQRKLRQLVKGLFRIAFKAQEKKGSEPFVKIVPVGLDFSHYSNFRARVIIKFGTPIEVSEYYKSYENNQAHAYNELRDRLAEDMKKYMLHIETSTYYDTVWNLKEVSRNVLTDQKQKYKSKFLRLFDTDQSIIDRINLKTQNNEQLLEPIKPIVDRYFEGLTKMKIRTWVLDSNISLIYLLLVSLVHFILLPIFLFGYLNNIIAYHLPNKLVKGLKDKQFHNSVKYVIGLFVVLIIYIIQSSIVYLAFDSGFVAILYFFSLYYTGVLAFDYYIYFKKLKAQWKFKILSIFKDKRIESLKTDRNTIINFTKDITGL